MRRTRGIYMGHVGHEGHIPRTMLALMEEEGVVSKADNDRWTLREHGSVSQQPGDDV